jgi:hypothetical protein
MFNTGCEEGSKRSNCVNPGKERGDVRETRIFEVVKGVEYESRSSSHGLDLPEDELRERVIQL